MPPDTTDTLRKPEPARLRLRRILITSPGGYGAAARSMGCSKQALYRITKGDGKPGRELSVAIEREYGIPVETWGLS